MKYCNNTIKFLSESLGTSLTPLQETMVYINATTTLEDYDIATFAENNHLTPSMDIARLANFGSMVEDYWRLLSPEEVEKYQNNPAEYYQALAEYEQKYKNHDIRLSFLEKFGFVDDEIEALEKNLAYKMLEAIKTNRRLVIANIQYLIDLGVTNFKDIYNKYYELFLMDYSNFVEIFNKYDQDDLVAKLEKNIAILEYL